MSRRPPEETILFDLLATCTMGEALAIVRPSELSEIVAEAALQRARVELQRNLSGMIGFSAAAADVACREASDETLIEEVSFRVTRALEDLCVSARRYETREGD